MIWIAGRIVADDAVSISVLDRALEHGLGLFETLRTYNGRAPLLDRHLSRLTRSAEALGLPVQPADLPADAAVTALVSGNKSDLRLRITLSGGGPSGPACVWMRAAPLPSILPSISLLCGPWTVVESDPLARHKSLNYWSRRLAYETAQARGSHEILSLTPDGCCWEGSRTNLFVVSADKLRTPTATGPIVPGVMRGLVIERARAAGIVVEDQRRLSPADLAGADEVFLTNSVRGIMPVGRFQETNFSTLGPLTERLQKLVGDWLQPGSETT